MNVGYAMIGTILLDVVISLGFVIVTSFKALFNFIRRGCRTKKKGNKYQVNLE